MKALHNILIEVDDELNDESGGIIRSNILSDASAINRIGKVVSVPKGMSKLSPGDEIIMHHNISRIKLGMRGKIVFSDFRIHGRLYKVPFDMVYMYRKPDSEWICLDPFCFVRPVKKEDEVVDGLVVHGEGSDTHKGMSRNIGEVAHPCPAMGEMGIRKGDLVAFSDYSEYEFEVDGEILYKMEIKDLLGVVNEGA